MPDAAAIEREIADLRDLSRELRTRIAQAAQAVPWQAKLFKHDVDAAHHYIDVATQQLGNALVVGMPDRPAGGWPA